MIDIAIKMLVGDRTKYSLLVSGVCFSTLLIGQGLSMFFGILGFSYATLDNIRSPLWVVDPLVENVQDNQPLRDTDVDRVRSVDGVAWAAPLYVGSTQARVLGTGATKQATLVGVDPSTLAGAPTRVISGKILDLRRSQSVVIDTEMATRLSANPLEPLQVGAVFEMNDQRAEVVAVVKAKQGMGGAAYIFTTWDRARQYAPSQRKTVSHILAAPQLGRSAAEVARAISKSTGLKAVTEDEFKLMNRQWMLANSPVPFVTGLIVVLGFFVGTILAGQTFYTFILENTRYLGALKAMGASNRVLAGMTLLQAAIVGVIGYGIGMGLLALLFKGIPEGKAPLILQWPTALFVFGSIVIIVFLASILGVIRVIRIEPAIVFRA